MCACVCVCVCACTCACVCATGIKLSTVILKYFSSELDQDIRFYVVRSTMLTCHTKCAKNKNMHIFSSVVLSPNENIGAVELLPCR